MSYLSKFCLSIKTLIFFVFCIVLGGIFLNTQQASALNISDILNTPTVLGLSTSSLYPYPTASLVKDGGTIYFISGTTKVPFTNYKAFTGLGYSLKNVVNGDLTNYSLSQGYLITTANARHPWGSWLSYNKVIYYSSQSGMIGVPSADIFLANQGQWNLVVPANKYDIAILKASPLLPVLAYADSRIIGQPVLQFGGMPSGNNLSPVVMVPVPVIAPSTPTSSTTSVVSFLPQLVLPADIYSSTTATFSAPSADPNGPLVYTFTWDDGTAADTLSVGYAVHTYYLPGVYMLNITVSDKLTNTYSTTVPVTVVSPPSYTPSVPQISVPSGAIVGSAVTVTASATDPQGLTITYTYSWGDSSPSTVTSDNTANHTYTSSASYIVTVTATNSQGFTNLSSASFYVAP